MSRSTSEEENYDYNRDFINIERTIELLEEVSDKRYVFELIQDFKKKYTFIEFRVKLRKDVMYLMNLLNEKEYGIKDECK